MNPRLDVTKYLTSAVVVINGWNRLAVSFRAPAGSYQPRAMAVQHGAGA